tara:strand:+ start:719 stop:937 length:219 start_codon:yes stop_codon:yes gene_type:complete
MDDNLNKPNSIAMNINWSFFDALAVHAINKQISNNAHPNLQAITYADLKNKVIGNIDTAFIDIYYERFNTLR